MENRIIKFRGKRLDNGEWVYGWYFVSDSSLHSEVIHYIIVDEVRDRESILMAISGENFACYKVIPETVGQFTGLKDKNGKVLDWWEGDIFDHLGHKGLIEWYEGGLYYHDQGGYTPIGDVLVWAVIPTKIGNIHENPELLEANK